jgi:hypothetical protein
VEEAGDAEVILQKETMGDVSDGSFNDLDFDDSSSQEIWTMSSNAFHLYLNKNCVT